MVRPIVKEAVVGDILRGAVGGSLLGAGTGAGFGAIRAEEGERGAAALRGAAIGAGTGLVGGGLVGAGGKLRDDRIARIMSKESPDVAKRYQKAGDLFDDMKINTVSGDESRKRFDNLIDAQQDYIDRSVAIGNREATPSELALRYGGHTIGAGGALLAAPIAAKALMDRDMNKRASAYQAEGFAEELLKIHLQKEAGLRDLAAKAKGAVKGKIQDQ